MILSDLKTNIELILGVLTLDRCKSDFDRNCLAFVIQLHSICHFCTHCNNGMARYGKNCIDKIVLYLSCVCPRRIIVFSLSFSYLRLVIKYTALVIPSVRKAVDNYNAVLAYSRIGDEELTEEAIGQMRRDVTALEREIRLNMEAK